MLPAGCSNEPSEATNGGAEKTPPPAPVAMEAMPARFAKKCRAQAAVAPACPARLPVPAEDPSSPPMARWYGPGELAPDASFFFVQWGAPSVKISGKSAPPEVLHLIVAGSPSLDALYDAFAWPTRLDEDPTAPPDKNRRKALLLGRPTWGGRSGDLVLAPAYPFGGQDGEHLIFRWKDGDMERSISLHAWLPIEDAMDTTRAIVESVP